MELIVLVVLALTIAAVVFGKSSNDGKPSGPLASFYPPIADKLVLRNDIQGLGHFGAPRGSRKHQGIDFVAVPGMVVKAPISGNVRSLQVYNGDPTWKGVSITSGDLEVKMFYVAPFANLPKSITRGTLIGSMQNRAATSTGMINHIHVEVWLKGKLQDPSKFFNYIK